MSEIQEAVQIIRVAYDGVEIAMKVGSGTIGSMKKAVDFLVAILEYEKSLGKTSMRKLLQKGGDLQVLQFATEDMKRVKKMAKKYGVLYSVLPDMNKNDGKSEIIFHTEAVPRVTMISQKIKFGRITNVDEFLKNGNEKDLDNFLSFLRSQQMGNEFVHTEESARAGIIFEGLIEKVGLYAMEKQSISVDGIKDNFQIDRVQAENVVNQLEHIGVLKKDNSNGNYKVMMDKEAFINRIRGYQELADRIRTVANSKNLNLVDVTISKQLIVEENEHAIKTRIPGGKGKCIWTEKSNIMEIHDGKTLLTFLDRNKDYKLYSEDNRVMETINGEKLYEAHYDQVGNEVRDRYAKAQVQESKTAAVSRKR